MVMKSFNGIKKHLPDLLHIVMFYNDGTVFQTTFKSPVNVPKLGISLSETLRDLKSTANYSDIDEKIDVDVDNYVKLIYETQQIKLIVIKLGEESNIALFLDNAKKKKVNLEVIKNYLDKLEEIVDMDEEEVIQCQEECEEK